MTIEISIPVEVINEVLDLLEWEEDEHEVGAHQYLQDWLEGQLDTSREILDAIMVNKGNWIIVVDIHGRDTTLVVEKVSMEL